MNTRLITNSLATALILAASSANGAVTVVDPVAESEVNPFVSASLGSGVTVTGSSLRSALVADVDVNTVSWGGNGYVYRNSSSSPGSVTFSVPSGGYFTDVGAQIIVNRGAIGDSLANALDRFTFESSTNGTDFSTFSVSGSADAANGGDWQRYNITTTALDALTDISHLRVTITQKATGGAGWHQVLGSATMDVVAIPEPSAALLGSLGLLCLFRRRRA